MSSEPTRVEVFEKSTLEERDYWTARLSRELEPSNITLDFERPGSYSGKKDSIDIALPEETHQALKKLTGSSHFLIYAALLTALNICLRKYTGNSAIVVGSPSRKKDDNSPGGASALAILTELSGAWTVKQLLLNVRESLLDAYSRQQYPFERLVRDLGFSKVDNRCPLFDIALALRNIHNPLPELKNDISIFFATGDAATSGVIEFNKELFAKESIERFGNHLLGVLGQTLANPNSPIDNVEMLGEQERYRILTEWNDTKRVFREDKRVHEIFEEQAAAQPEAVAVIQEARRLTYQELNQQANQLARHLVSLGVGPESLVGVCFDRAADSVIAILAALKAGGAFVPLDPGYPAERLAFMLADSKVKVLLTLERIAGAIPDNHARVVCLDAEWDEISRKAASNLGETASSDNLAYVIYTSGSTGTPKGVMIGRRGLTNSIEAQIEAYRIKPESRAVQFASLSFDASVCEIFTTLVAGATLCFGSLESLMPGTGLVSFLRDNEITQAILPPSVLAALPDVDLPHLSSIVSAGEACSAEVVRRWSTGRRFVNAYGPTETTICATAGECTASKRTPTIGHPIWNTRTYILDGSQKPVPAGVSGELYIGGVTLARGYLNRPDLTAEKFVPDPFGDESGARLYRTGDLARYRADGRIEYLGRIDHQVKIRGFRIELGEIESVLNSHDNVRESIVIARQDSPGDKRLVGYLLAEGEAAPSTSELRAFLRDRLPDYMIPSAFVVLDGFPLTPNGKIDRRALPAPQARPELGASFVAPHTLVEKELAEIWVEILGVERVGVEDHFFDLGGHSLLATQVVSRVREAFQVEIPLRWFFVNEPTIAGLARAIEQFQIEQAEADELASALEELQELSDEEVQSLLAQEGLVTVQQD